MMNHYQTLQVNKRSTTREIRHAYKRLARNRHPDKAGGSKEEFQRLKEAYEILSSPKKRAEYDHQLQLLRPLTAEDKEARAVQTWYHGQMQKTTEYNLRQWEEIKWEEFRKRQQEMKKDKERQWTRQHGGQALPDEWQQRQPGKSHWERALHLVEEAYDLFSDSMNCDVALQPCNSNPF